MAKDPQVGAIMKSLSFEVEASPHDNIIQLTSSANSTPVNVKIKVRKKKDVDAQHAIVSIPKYGQTGAGKERIRLVSSDQTILSFKMYLENVAEEKLMKKHGKSFFGKFKPGGCLDPNRDEDDVPYSPPVKTITDVTRSISDHSLTTKPTIITDNAQPDLKNAKNKDEVHFWKKRGTFAKDGIQAKKSSEKMILGKCKPGGCLDPPFGEDRYSYKPQEVKRIATDSSITVQEQEENTNTESTLNKVEISKRKKSRADDKKDSDSILSVFESDCLKQVPSNSHSIITYPPNSTSSDQKLYVERNGSKEQCKRTSVVYRKSFTGSTENYFYPKSGSTSIVSRNKFKTHDRTDTKDLQSKTEKTITANNAKNYKDEQSKNNTSFIIKNPANEEPQVSSLHELKNPVTKTQLKTNKEVEPPNDNYKNLQRSSLNKLIAQDETINNGISKDPPVLTIVNLPLEISNGVQNIKRTSKETERDKVSLNSIYNDQKNDKLQVEYNHVVEEPDIVMPIADVINVENRKLSKPSSVGSPNRSLGGIRRKSLSPIVPVTVPKSARAPSTVIGHNNVERKSIASTIPANSRGKDNVKLLVTSKTKDGINTKTLNTSPASRRSTSSSNKVFKNKLETYEMVADTPQRISKISSGKYYPANGHINSGSPRTTREKKGSKDLKSIDVTSREFIQEKKDTFPKKDEITYNPNIGKEKVETFEKRADEYQCYPIESSTTRLEDEGGFTQSLTNGQIVDMLRRKENQNIDVTQTSNVFLQGKSNTSPTIEVIITNHANMGKDRTKSSHNEIGKHQSYPINSPKTKTENKVLLNQPTAKEITSAPVEDKVKQENGGRAKSKSKSNQSLTTGNSKIKERISTKSELKETIMTYDLERTQSPQGTNIRYSLNLKNGDTPFDFDTEISNKRLLAGPNSEMISNNLTQTLELTTATDAKENNDAIKILSVLELKASEHSVLKEKNNLPTNKQLSMSLSGQPKKNSTTLILEKQPKIKTNIKRYAYTEKASNEKITKLSSENTETNELDNKFAKNSADKPFQSIINYEVADDIAILQKEIRVAEEPLHYISRESLKSLTIDNPQIKEPSPSMKIINKTKNDFNPPCHQSPSITKQHDTLKSSNTNSFQKIYPNSGMEHTDGNNLQYANNLTAPMYKNKLSNNNIKLPELFQNNTIATEIKNDEYLRHSYEQDKPISLSKKSDVPLSIDKKETNHIQAELKKSHEDLFKHPFSVEINDNDNNNKMRPEIDNIKNLYQQAHSGHKEEKVNNMAPLPDSQNINKYGTQNFDTHFESFSSADNNTTLNNIDETAKPILYTHENFHSTRDTFELRQSPSNSYDQTRDSGRVFNLFDILSSTPSVRPSSEQKGATNMNFASTPQDDQKHQTNRLIRSQEINDKANIIPLKNSQPDVSSQTYFNKNNFKHGAASDTGSKAPDRYEQDIVDSTDIIQDNVKSQKTYNSDLDQYAPQKVTISYDDIPTEDKAKYKKAWDNGQEESNAIQSFSSNEALLLKTKNYEHRVSPKTDSCSYSNSLNDNTMKTTPAIAQHVKPIPSNEVRDKQESYTFKNYQNEAQITLTTDTNEDNDQKSSSKVINYPSSNEMSFQIQSGDEKEEIKYVHKTSSISLETTVRQASKMKLNENDDVHENISLKNVSDPSSIKMFDRIHSDDEPEETKHRRTNTSSTSSETSVRQVNNIEFNGKKDVNGKMCKDIGYLSTIESQTRNYDETKEIKSSNTSSAVGSWETPVGQLRNQETKVRKSNGNENNDDKISANDINYRFAAESPDRIRSYNDLKEIKYPKTQSAISQETLCIEGDDEEPFKEINYPPQNESPDRIPHYNKIDQIKYPETSFFIDEEEAMEQVRKIKTNTNQNDDKKITSREVNYPLESSETMRTNNDVEEIKYPETMSAIRRETPLGQVWYRKVNGNEDDGEKLSSKDINYLSSIESSDRMQSNDKTDETKFSQDASSFSRETSVGKKEGLDIRYSPITSIVSMHKFESKHTVSFHDRKQDIIEIPEIPVQDIVLMDLAFKHHLNEDNESALKSYFPGTVSDGGKIVSFKGKVETGMDIKIPIDTQHSLKVQITKSSQTGRDAVLQASRRKMPEFQRTSYEIIGRELDTVLSSLYIQHLLPLQNIIVSLKQDVDSLVSQQDLVNQLVLKRKRSARVRAVKKCYCHRNIN